MLLEFFPHYTSWSQKSPAITGVIFHSYKVKLSPPRHPVIFSNDDWGVLHHRNETHSIKVPWNHSQKMIGSLGPSESCIYSGPILSPPRHSVFAKCLCRGSFTVSSPPGNKPSWIGRRIVLPGPSFFKGELLNFGGVCAIIGWCTPLIRF